MVVDRRPPTDQPGVVHRLGALRGRHVDLLSRAKAPYPACRVTVSEFQPTNSSSFTAWSAAIISAAFSPIMMHAALVLPLMMFGITLASATRRFFTPISRRRGSTTLPMRQVLVGW